MKYPIIVNTEELQAALEEMRALESATDPEAAHPYADGILIRVLNMLGQHELTEAFEAVPKWYS